MMKVRSFWLKLSMECPEFEDAIEEEMGIDKSGYRIDRSQVRNLLKILRTLFYK